MKLKEIVFNAESKKSAANYQKMLKWLDSPKRYKYNNPSNLVEKAGILKGQKVLEIGCGSGFFTAEIAKVTGNLGEVIATDIHPLAVKETAQKVEALKIEHVTVACEDAHSTSFADDSFDVIVLYGVVPSPVISLRQLSVELSRILKPNGICAIWTAVPFWRPVEMLKQGRFTQMKRQYPVFKLQKINHEER
ncbi:class I SAM-dependent methyltransferase [Fusibacter sp. 3D3]|uniref:class I SAM-dependent methyltransferase n=1 Tax=Fusibacter sp. 3D3 TaxID=1048380 RepID=UPI000853EB73|nr:class I SAM-dependent methyltransferase [Fusibacter sp. 3D3]GAU75993.1 ubiquinone/menaquinone biosynthesis methyltransferase [Fusibacter sp. 3D3]